MQAGVFHPSRREGESSSRDNIFLREKPYGRPLLGNRVALFAFKPPSKQIAA